MFRETRFRAARVGLAALVVAVCAVPTTRAEDPPGPGKPAIPDLSPDNKLSVVVAGGEMMVGNVKIVKVTVDTPDGPVEKEVTQTTKAYNLGGAKEKYLAAKFYPEKRGKPMIIAVSEKTVYAMEGASGDLLWTVEHRVKADEAAITFKGDEVTVTLGEKTMRYKVRTGKELND